MRSRVLLIVLVVSIVGCGDSSPSATSAPGNILQADSATSVADDLLSGFLDSVAGTPLPGPIEVDPGDCAGLEFSDATSQALLAFTSEPTSLEGQLLAIETLRQVASGAEWECLGIDVQSSTVMVSPEAAACPLSAASSGALESAIGDWEALWDALGTLTNDEMECLLVPNEGVDPACAIKGECDPRKEEIDKEVVDKEEVQKEELTEDQKTQP